jgi:parallel beta-helix repeat protein
MNTPPTGGPGSGFTITPRRPKEDLSGDRLVASLKKDAEGRPVLGGIPLICRLGKGGMGAVYYGIHPRLQVEVAVKILPHHLMDDDPRIAERFVTEARMAAALASDHIVRVLDVDVDQGTHYIEMEFVDGESAGSIMRRVGALRPDQALDIVIAATRGLAAAHERGIIHRDIKPDNILIPRGKLGELELTRAKLADLGLAKPDNSAQSLGTAPHVAMGTPGFMAPEQVDDARSAGHPADVFSMGATLYALLAGKAPFYGTSLGTILRDTAMKEPDPLPETISPVIRQLVARCLDKKPGRRFVEGRDLLHALENAQRAMMTERTLLTIPTDPVQPPELPPTMVPTRPADLLVTKPTVPGPGPGPALPPTMMPTTPAAVVQTTPPKPGGSKTLVIVLIVLLVLGGIGVGIGYPMYAARQRREQVLGRIQEAQKAGDEWTALKADEGPEVVEARRETESARTFLAAGAFDEASDAAGRARDHWRKAVTLANQHTEAKKAREAAQTAQRALGTPPDDGMKALVRGDQRMAGRDYEGAKSAFAEAEKIFKDAVVAEAKRLESDASAAQVRALKLKSDFEKVRPDAEAKVKQLSEAMNAAWEKSEAEQDPAVKQRLEAEYNKLSNEHYRFQGFVEAFVKHIVTAKEGQEAASHLAVGETRLQDGKWAQAIASYKEAAGRYEALQKRTDALRASLDARGAADDESMVVYRTLERLYGQNMPEPSPRQVKAREAYAAAFELLEKGDFAGASEAYRACASLYDDMFILVPSEVKSAADALAAATEGDFVMVDGGTHAGPFRIPDGVRFIGENNPTLRCAATASVVTLGSTSLLARFTIEHTTTDTDDSRFSCVDIRSGSPFVVGCFIRKSAGHGVYIGGGTAEIKSCTITANGWDGVSVQGAGTTPTITLCILSDNGESGVAFAGGSSGTLSGNEIARNALPGVRILGKGTSPVVDKNDILENAQAGILASGGAQPTITTNQVLKNKGQGIHVTGSGSAPVAKANVIKENASNGFFIEESAGGTYEENTCEANTLSGFSVTSRGTSPQIVRNTCKSNKSAGMFINGNATPWISGNTCTLNGSTGIYCSDAGTAAAIERNLCTFNTYHGISFNNGAGGKATGNTCDSNKDSGIASFGKGTGATQTGNTCRKNEHYGIYAGAEAGGTITDNVCSENIWSGVGVAGAGSSPTVTGNTLNTNGRWGLEYWDGASPTVRNNKASGNTSGQVMGQ